MRIKLPMKLIDSIVSMITLTLIELSDDELISTGSLAIKWSESIELS